MITIYESTQTGVPSHMGLGVISPSSCIITEELNGQFELIMTFPFDDFGKWERIENQRIIKAPYNGSDQLFRIYNSFRDPISQKLMVVQARHIFYDLLYNFLEDVRPTVKDGQDAGDYILDGCQTAHAFTFSSNITAISTAYYVRQNPVAAFIGTEDQSFIKRWGGEIRRDNYGITINTRTGSTTPRKIAYGKNIAGLDITVDDSAVVTRVMPTALDQNGTVFYTDVKYYDSPRIGDYPAPRYGTLDTGIRAGQEINGSIPYPDIATAKAAMAAMAAEYFAAGADMPKITLNVTYADLSKTIQYKDYAALFSIGLGDDVNVFYPSPQNINIDQRVIQIKWDAVLNKLHSCVIGDFAPNIAQTVVSNDIDISALKTNIEGALRENELYNGVYVNHQDGVKTVAVIGGKTITTKQNSVNGFAIYEGTTLIGGVVVEDGKVLLKGNATEITGVIDGKTITIKLNPAEGFSVYDGSTYKGGVAVVDGEVGVIGNKLMNDIGGDCYATIGSITEGATTYNGIFLYRKVSGTFALLMRLLVSEGGILIRDQDNQNRIQIGAVGGDIVLSDRHGNMRMSLVDSHSRIYPPVGFSGGGLTITNDYCNLVQNGHAIGVDNDGPYYQKSGYSKVHF